MRFFRSSSVLLASALLLSATLSVPTFAQQRDAAYEAKRVELSAERVDTLGELSALAPKIIGKSVEVRGLVQGAFSRGEGVALLLALPDGGTLLLDAPASFKSHPAARPGAWMRALCTVSGVERGEAKLQVVAATDRVDNAPVVRRTEGLAVSEATVAALQAPPPEIIVASEVELPEGFDITRPAPLEAGNLTTNVPQTLSAAQTKPPTPRATAPRASRSLPRPRQSATGASQSTSAARKSSFFGFGDAARNAYASFAQRYNPRLTPEKADYIAVSLLRAAQAHDLDPRFLAAVVQVESSFDPTAVSSAGATGLGQLMPFNLAPLGVQNTWDPAQNLMGAAKLLRENLNKFKGHANGTLMAVAAYHAGAGAVGRSVKATGSAIPKASTHKYVWKVYHAYKALAPELF